MLSFGRVSIGSGGIAGCMPCGGASGQEFQALESVRAEVERVRAAALDNVLLAGAEPFRHPELPALITTCTDAGFVRIAMETDAGALAIPENAAGSVAAGLRQIHVPLLGPDAASHDPLVHSASFDQVTAGVTRFLEAAERARVQVVLVGVVPLCDHTLVHAPAIVATFARMGAVAVRLIRADDVPRDAPTITAAFETGMVNGVWVWDDHLADAGAALSGMHAPMRIVGACS